MNHHPKPVLRAIQNTTRCMSGSFASSPASESDSPKPRSAATPPTPAAIKKTIGDIEKLNKQVRSAKAKNDVLSDHVKFAEDQLKSRDKLVAKLKENLTELKSELNHSVPQADYDRLKCESEKLKETISQLKSNEKFLSQSNTTLQDDLKFSRKFVEDLENKIKSLEPAAKKFPEVESERDTLVNELRRLSEKLIQSEQLRKEEREALTASYERQIAILEELIPYKSSRFDLSSPLLTECSPPILTGKDKSSEGESLSVFHEMRCKELEEQLQRVQREIDEKTRQIQQLSDQLADYDCKLSILNTEKAHLSYDREQMSSKIKHLEEQLSSKEIELSTLRAKFEKSEKEHTSQINSLTLALSRRESDLKISQSKLIDASKVIESLRTSASLSVDEINSLKMFLDEEKNRAHHLSTLLDLNQKELKDSGRVIVTMKSSNDNLVTEVNDLKKKIDRLQPENDNYKQKIDQLLADLSKTSEELRSTSQQLEDLRTRFSGSQVEQSAQLGQLQDELKAKQTALDNVVREKDDLTEKLAQVSYQLAATTRESDELRSSSIKLQEILNEHEKLKVDHQEETSRLRSRLEELSLIIESKETENRVLQEEKSKIEASMARISTEMDTDTAKAKEEIAQLKKSLEECNEKYTRQHDELNAIWDKLIEEQAAASHERIEREALKEENEQLKSTVESLTSFKSQVSVLANEKTVLTNQLDQVKREKEQLEKQIAAVRSEMDLLKEQNEKISLTRSQSEAEMKRLTSLLKERANLRSDTVERMEQTIADIRKSCAESHLKEIQRLNSDLSRFNEMLSKKDQQIKQLSDEWRIAEDSFKIERATKSRLLNENIKLERRLADLTHSGILNTTFVMPKADDCKFSRPTSPILVSSTPASNCSQERSVASRVDSFKRPLPIACSNLFVDEEPQQFMSMSSICSSDSTGNISSKTLPQVKQERQSEEDPLDRISILASRNKRQPLHLRTSYPAEFQELIIDEAALKGIGGKGKLTVSAPRGEVAEVPDTPKVPVYPKPVSFTTSFPSNPANAMKRPSSPAPSSSSSDEMRAKASFNSSTSGMAINPSSRSVFRNPRVNASLVSKKSSLNEIQC